MEAKDSYLTDTYSYDILYIGGRNEGRRIGLYGGSI